VAGLVVARNYDSTPVPMAVGVALCTMGTLASYHLIVRLQPRRG